MSSRKRTTQGARKRKRLDADVPGDEAIAISEPSAASKIAETHDQHDSKQQQPTPQHDDDTEPIDAKIALQKQAADTASAKASTDQPAASPLREIVGYCFCQDWRVTIREPVPGVVVCHCKDCQAISSSFFCTYVTAKSRAFVTVEPSDREARNVLTSTFYYTIKTGENAGKKQSRTFCSRCGTVLFATPESLEGALPINRNLFITPENDANMAIVDMLSPKIEIFVRDRAAWRPGQENVIHEWDGMPGHL